MIGPFTNRVHFDWIGVYCGMSPSEDLHCYADNEVFALVVFDVLHCSNTSWFGIALRVADETGRQHAVSLGSNCRTRTSRFWTNFTDEFIKLLTMTNLLHSVITVGLL